MVKKQLLHSYIVHYGSEKPAEILHENSTNREAIVTSDITTEWKTYHQLLVNKPENDMKAQLKELASNDMIKTLFPNLSKIGAMSLNPYHDSFSRKKLFLNEKKREEIFSLRCTINGFVACSLKAVMSARVTMILAASSRCSRSSSSSSTQLADGKIESSSVWRVALTILDIIDKSNCSV